MRLQTWTAWLIVSMGAALAMIAAGCATTSNGVGPPANTFSTVGYFPYQVKGYQGTYPRRRMVVLETVDARDYSDAGAADHQPLDGNPAAGIVLDASGHPTEHIYTAPLGPILQISIREAAEEAGLVATASNATLDDALKDRREDYVLSSRIMRCWVNKHGIQDPAQPGLASWSTNANVTLEVTIYKPPFKVPFWQGISTDDYNDPPTDNASGLSDDTPIYSEPSEVLSVALTRAVAGIFKRDALHSLIVDDTMAQGH